MQKLSVVIPALNEEQAIERVLLSVPIQELLDMGYETELMVVDNGSTDKTGPIAKKHGATVFVQPVRGYGNAYKAGFANATGDIIATGDADLTYPFEDLPKLIKKLVEEELDFINTDRLTYLNPEAMSFSHQIGNWLLTMATKVLYRWPHKDSQSGMWIFRREIWSQLNVVSSGMPFSQELKMEAWLKGFKCDEVPIVYRARAGKEKLNTITDGIGNITQLIFKRILG